MSSSVRQMLGVPAGSTKRSSGSSRQKTTGHKKQHTHAATHSHKKPTHAKPKGQLLNLSSAWTSSNISTLAPTIRPVFKKRRMTNISWKFVPIKSSARTDNMDLKHWVKILKVPDYRFAKLNKKVRLMRYSEEEYNKYLQDGNWTRKETDMLFDLCENLDLRFVVIADRFNQQLRNQAQSNSDAKDKGTVSDSNEQNTSLANGGITRRPKRKYNVLFNISEFNPEYVEEEKTDVQTHGEGGELQKSTQNGGAMDIETIGDSQKDNENNGNGNDISNNSNNNDNSNNSNNSNNSEQTGTLAAGASNTTTATTATTATTPSPSPTTSTTTTTGTTGNGTTPGSNTTADTNQDKNGVSNSIRKTQSRVWPLPRQHPREKSVEQLKGRFYFIQRALLKARNSSDPELKHHKMFKNMYDMSYEEERKDQLARIFLRTKEEEKEMAAYVLENRRLVQQLKKLKKSSKSAKKEVKASKATKRKQTSSSSSTTAADSSSTTTAPSMPGFKPSNALADIPDSCTPKDITKERPTGCYLRSNMMKNSIHVVGRVAKQLETQLMDLGFKNKTAPFTIPSKKNVETYDALRRAIVTYINLSKHVSKRSADRDMLRAAFKPKKVKRTKKEKGSRKNKH